MKRNERGFTLMELMVVIVIVAILAAVAVPLYINYVKDAQRTEAKGAIGAIISAEQVYYQSPAGKGNYKDVLTAPGDFKAILNVDLTDTQANWTFAISTTSDPTNGFKVTATGISKRPSEGLVVEYKHDRLKGATWGDETTPIP